jgi:peptidoglycan/xylan/chitin deacetylase (PgdA/CDA1 family)
MKYFRILSIVLTLGVFSIFFLWLKSHRSPQLFGKCIHRVTTAQKVVALTYDDGPSLHTGELLAILRKYEVRATFFLLGKNGETHPALVRQIHEEGHELGNHSYSHQPLIFKFPSFIREEIDKTDRIIRQSGYVGTIHFRAPYGRKLFALPWILSKLNRPHQGTNH